MQKIYFRTIVSIVSFFFFFSACDKIDKPVTIISQQLSTDGFLDTLYFIDAVRADQKQVLLEDFTGHKCVNCPEAAIAAHELAEDLNHKLVIYSIHAGYYAEPDQTGYYTADFRSPAGDELNNYFQILANPIALINRVKYNGSLLVGAGNWETAVMLEIVKPNSAEMNIRNIYYPNLNKLQIDVLTKILIQPSGKYKLVLFIAEDRIISPQRNNNPGIGPSPDWLEYEHRNILRSSINSTFGTPISVDGTMVQNQEYSNQFIFDLNPAWITSNCNIIAYVYSEDTEEILQVAELGIKTN